ncbi:MAG: hypothetical protein EXS14_01730 [Planctomycetes bacterium]|nr:hypothetical protein [Planctomycetota bacterium]
MFGHSCLLTLMILPVSLLAQVDRDLPGVSAVLEALKTPPANATLLPLRSRVDGVLVALPGAVPPSQRPCLLVVAGLNPDHRVGVQLAARLPAALFAAAQTDTALAETLARYTIEVIAAPAPEALEFAASGPVRECRATPEPVDDDNDGLVDEDGPDDLDGDGIIATLRAPDANGVWRSSDEDARLLVKADVSKGERGVWKIVSEGIDNDGDGLVNEDGPGGVDLDRNFAHGWKEAERSAGSSCPSETASRALLEHVLQRRTVAAVYVLGWRDNIAQLARTNDAAAPRAPNGLLPEDVAWAKPLTASLAKILGANDGTEDSADGGFHQWAYAQYGVPAFASRVVYRTELPAEAKLPSGKAPESVDAKWLLHSDLTGGVGFMPWKACAHPTWKGAELGGFMPLWKVSADEERLAVLLQAQVKAVAAIVQAFSVVRIETLDSKALGSGLHEITVDIFSRGSLPMATAQARVTRVAQPLLVRFACGEARLIDGAVLTKLERLGDGGHERLRWLVQTDGHLDVKVSTESPRSGADAASLKVEVR